MEIIRLLNAVARENTYLLINDEACLVIDPGSDHAAIIHQLEKQNRPLAAILLTHTHYDHIMSVDILRERYACPVYVSEKEADWLFTPELNLSGLDRHSDMPDVIIKPADAFFNYHSPYQLSGFQFSVVPTPGHSHGGVSFIFEKEETVFSGDALFKETVGRTDLPTSNFDDLISGIKEQLLTLPNHYTVYPGHGWDTTIGHEKTFNPFLN